ncbi:MAG: hypothetical protein JXA23_06665 [Bacteroidales bacterium]|nr:hypothetical protein [Bacteroidales bacterium]
MNHSPEIKAFIREHSALFWYTPEDKKEEISEELLVEMILNYGDLDAIRKLIGLMGIKKVADIFFTSVNLSPRRKGNYFDTTLNFFTLFFQRYAS